VRILAAPGRLEVVDDGPGIAEDDLPRAFDRFYLYDKLRAERRVGTGLGLAIVRELVEAMHGSTEARSEVGVGSTFTIHLPLPEGMVAPAEGARPAFVLISRT
jgi:signal transduction histidine kinase